MWPLLWVWIVKQNSEQGFPNHILSYLPIVPGAIPVAKHGDDSVKWLLNLIHASVGLQQLRFPRQLPQKHNPELISR